MLQQFIVDWLMKEIGNTSHDKIKDLIDRARKKEMEYLKEELIGFQSYLCDQGHITDHDWDYEKEAKVYLYDKTI